MSAPQPPQDARLRVFLDLWADALAEAVLRELEAEEAAGDCREAAA